MDDLQLAKKMVELSNSAKTRGIEFSLGFKDIKRLMATKKCKYTGIELKRYEGPIDKMRDDRFTIDRIDAKKGYIPGNVVACGEKFNMRKGNLTEEDIMSIYKVIQARKKAEKAAAARAKAKSKPKSKLRIVKTKSA